MHQPKHVLQKHTCGCMIATTAMVLGVSYEDALKEYPTVKPDESGMDYGMFEQVVVEHGWAVARKWKHYRVGGRDREVWPVEPWADLHEVQVRISDRMDHSVLMLRDGTVLDPLTPEPRKLSDYSRVMSIAALTKLN
jgi:hypothetical protein